VGHWPSPPLPPRDSSVADLEVTKSHLSTLTSTRTSHHSQMQTQIALSGLALSASGGRKNLRRELSASAFLPI
jgi:hypothetical protein